MGLSGVGETGRVGQLDDEVLELDEFLGFLLRHVLVALRIDVVLDTVCLWLLLSWSIPSRRLSVIVVLFSKRRVGWLTLVGRSPHFLNRLSIVVNNVALVCQVSVEETTKYHDLVV